MDRYLDENKKCNKNNRKKNDVEEIIYSRGLSALRRDRVKLEDVSPYDYSKRSILDIKTEAING